MELTTQNDVSLSTPSCGGGCHAACGAPAPSPRPENVSLALRLEYLTVGWNLVEGVVAIGAALLAGSVAILGFGMDSFVECLSAGVMIWRLRAERSGRLSEQQLEAAEHRARKLVAASLFLLACYVSFEALRTLWTREHPAFSPVGASLLVLSLVVMLWLARAKRRVARELGSQAMEADAFQTTACWWLSLAALVGVGLNGLLGWWWADPVSALVIAGLIGKEGRDAWKGDTCC
jgi:divalent metal cation (Fe/Co/Zn/Cd) transporter